MADPTIADGGIVAIAAAALVQIARAIRDEKDRFKQKRNGGTPQDQIINEVKKLRRATIKSAKLQAKKLDQIHDQTQESSRALQGGLRTQAAQNQVLQDIGLGISRLLGRYDGG